MDQKAWLSAVSSKTVDPKPQPSQNSDASVGDQSRVATHETPRSEANVETLQDPNGAS